MLGRDWATELLQPALRVPQTGGSQQRLSCSESCCRKGFRRRDLSEFVPTKWMFTGPWEQVGDQAFCPRPLELGSSSQLPSGCHLVTPGCFQHSFSISGKGGPWLAWCFCK